MDFFDELGKKASETYQEVKDKASSLSEEIKLRTKINNLKERKNTMYTEIGEIVYSNIKDNKDIDREVVSAKCDELTAIFEEIAKLEEEVLANKNMKTCDGCGKRIDKNHKFCPHCGKEQPEIQKEEPVVETPEAPVEEHEEGGNQNSGENNE